MCKMASLAAYKKYMQPVMICSYVYSRILSAPDHQTRILKSKSVPVGFTSKWRVGVFSHTYAWKWRHSTDEDARGMKLGFGVPNFGLQNYAFLANAIRQFASGGLVSQPPKHHDYHRTGTQPAGHHLILPTLHSSGQCTSILSPFLSVTLVMLSMVITRIIRSTTGRWSCAF